MTSIGVLLPWINLLFLPVAIGVVGPKHRMLAAAFIVIGVISLWLQTDTLKAFDYPTGLTGLFKTPVETRGAVVYSVFNGLYLLLLHGLRAKAPGLLMPFTIAFYFGAFILSTFFMVL